VNCVESIGDSGSWFCSWVVSRVRKLLKSDDSLLSALLLLVELELLELLVEPVELVLGAAVLEVGGNSELVVIGRILPEACGG
jgi:hypothetical protein